LLEALFACALRAAAPTWEFEQINFVVGNPGCRSAAESDFYTKFEELDVHEGKKDRLFTDYVKQMYEAHDRVTLSFFEQVQGLVGQT